MRTGKPLLDNVGGEKITPKNYPGDAGRRKSCRMREYRDSRKSGASAKSQPEPGGLASDRLFDRVLGDDIESQLHAHIGVQLDLHLVLAEGLYRHVQVDLLAIDLDA